MSVFKNYIIKGDGQQIMTSKQYERFTEGESYYQNKYPIIQTLHSNKGDYVLVDNLESVFTPESCDCIIPNKAMAEQILKAFTKADNNFKILGHELNQGDVLVDCWKVSYTYSWDRIGDGKMLIFKTKEDAQEYYENLKLELKDAQGYTVREPEQIKILANTEYKSK